MKLFELHSLLLEATPNQMLKKYRNDLGSTWGALHNTPHDGPVDGRDVLNTILNPSDAKRDANATAAMDWLTSLAPGNKVNTYIEWLTKMFLTDNLDINDAEEIRYTLQAHAKAGNYANYRDPMQYRSMESMQNDLSDTIAKLRAKDAEAADAKAVSSGMGSKDSGAEAEQWIKGKMYRLNSVRAIKAFGSPQWCVSHAEQSAETRSSFCVSYSNNWDEPFFLLTLPELGKHMRKVGVFPGEHGYGNFQDYTNNPLPIKEIRDIFNKYPDIYELMKPHISASNVGWRINLSDEEKVDAYLAGVYPLDEVPNELRTEEFYHAAVRKSRMSIDQIPREYQTEAMWLDAGRHDPSSFVKAPEEYQTEENWRELIPVNADKFVPRHARKSLLSLPSKYLKDYEIITLLRTLHADDVSKKLIDVPKEHFTQEIVDTIITYAPKLIRYLPSGMLTDEVCDQIISREYAWQQVRPAYAALPEDYVKRNLDKINWKYALTNPSFLKYAPDQYQTPHMWGAQLAQQL